MKYTAIYREKGNVYYEDMTRNDYNSKEAFKADLRNNGYMVAAIFTDEQIEKIKDRDPDIIFKYSERIVEYVRECIE
jgi:hypothetical protein